MENKKLEAKLRDWANDLAFKLPDGSAPPSSYFALLTATPHRRQLWETLIESVQPRQKIEQMRKQIMVAKLKDRKKLSGKCDSALVTDRIEAWHKQCALENQIKEKRKEAVKLERNIIAKVSDVVFEICKQAELEKLYEDISEKALALKLFTKREQDMVKSLEKILLKAVGASSSSEYSEVHGLEKNVDHLKNELMSAEECRGPFDEDHACNLKSKLKELFESGMSEQTAWEEMMNWKKSILGKFDLFLEELNSNEKSVLSEKEAEIKKNLKASITQLKQKTTEKSLQVILNSLEAQALDWEVEKLEGMFSEEPVPKGSPNGTLSEPMSPLAFGGISESFAQGEKAVKNVKKYANVVGLKSYKEFLMEESKKLEEEIARAEKETGKELEPSAKALQAFDTTIAEIYSERSGHAGLAEEILRNHEKLVLRLHSLREEEEEKNKTMAVEDANKLKCASGKLIDVFMETPLDAFRTVESCSGRLLFECESLAHCFNGYGGELSKFFSALLIPPGPEAQLILAEIDTRQKMSAQLRNVIRRRDELAQLQRKMQQRMDSLTLDTRLCEKNFKEADGILWGVLIKSDELLRGTDFIERILRNWVEQPYRWMVGKS